MTSISVKKQCFFSVIRNEETRISFFFSDAEDKDRSFWSPFEGLLFALFALLPALRKGNRMGE